MVNNRAWNISEACAIAEMRHLLSFVTDINELCIGTDTECDVNAECINTAGSFLCVCNAGYSGDGFNCTSRFERKRYIEGVKL